MTLTRKSWIPYSFLRSLRPENNRGAGDIAEMLIAAVTTTTHLTIAVANSSSASLWSGERSTKMSLCVPVFFSIRTQLSSKISPSSAVLSISWIQPVILLRAMCILLPAGGVFSRFHSFFFFFSLLCGFRLCKRWRLDTTVPHLYPWVERQHSSLMSRKQLWTLNPMSTVSDTNLFVKPHITIVYSISSVHSVIFSWIVHKHQP